MSTLQEPPIEPRLAPSLQGLLAQLRRGIRLYIWAEGIALVLVVLGAAFWFSLGFDWLFEPPAPLRVALLALAIGALGVVAFRYIFRRAFVRLGDASLAVLLERHFHQFQDSLLTTVEMAYVPDHAREFNPEMLEHTQEAALAGARALDLRSMFNLRPLWRRGLLGVALAASVLAFGVCASDALRCGPGEVC